MSKISLKRRKFQIRLKQKRKMKLAKLRQDYLQAKTGNEKEKIWEKASKIAPWLSQEEFLAPVRKKK